MSTDTQRTQEWLAETMGTTKTQEEAEWFLVMWHADQRSGNSLRDCGEQIARDIANPPTYANLEEGLFQQFADWAGEEDVAREWAQTFYDQ